MTPNKRITAQPSDGSAPRPSKKRKPTIKFRLANDPEVEQVRATTIRQRSHGKLGYQKMDTVRSAERPIVEDLTGASQVEDALVNEELDVDYGIKNDVPAVTPKKKINTTSVS